MPNTDNQNINLAPSFYEVVFWEADKGFTKIDLNEKTLIPTLIERGHTLIGFASGSYLRAELIGQPKFTDLHGPMYNGPGVIRYEDAEANRVLSA